MEKERNTLLDFVKAVSALGVILVHFQFPGYFGAVMCSVGVIGVIIFFFIAGYSSYSADGSSAPKLLKRFKRNLMLLLTALLVYAVYEVILQLATGNFQSWLTQFADWRFYIRFFILGDFDFIDAGPLWFMLALLYCYLILYLIEKNRLHKTFYPLLPLLLLLRIGMETFTNSYTGSNPWITWHLSGNFLVGGLPIMLFGNYIACKKDKFVSIKTPVLLGGFATFLFATFLTVCFKINGTIDISQPFKIGAAFFVFILCLKHGSVHICSLLEYIGAFLTTYIYLYHNLIGLLIKRLIGALNVPEAVVSWTLPVLVMISAVLVSYVITSISKAAPQSKA